MRISLIIIACFAVTTAFAQGKYGYINYKVKQGETFASIASKYNISPKSLSNYNNLDFYNGRLIAKFLKVPLGKKNTHSFKPQPSTTILVKVNNADKLVSRDTITSISKVTAVDNSNTNRKPKYPISWINKNKIKHEQFVYGPGKFSQEFFSSALTITLITLCIIGIIYFYLSVKKRRFFAKQKMKVHIIKLVTGAILNEPKITPGKEVVFEIPRILQKQLHEKNIRQLVVNEIVTAKKTLKGSASDNLVGLYKQLNLDNDSVAKLNSRKWFIKARGIQELTVMDQDKFKQEIFSKTNSKNEYVRMEAQSAVVHFAGFKGLKFLQTLQFTISDWQQIKLIDQLNKFGDDELPDARKLLQSTNQSVIIFTLKIISVFKYLSLHNAVVHCVNNPNNVVRFHAIKCLKEISNSSTAGVLEKMYVTEILKNKIAVLKTLKDIGDKEQTDFLYNELFNINDNIKFAAAEALMQSCPNAIELITTASIKNGHPFTGILHLAKQKV